MTACTAAPSALGHPSRPLTAAPCAALAAGPLEVAPNLMQQLGSVLAVEPGPGGPLCGVFAPQLCTSVMPQARAPQLWAVNLRGSLAVTSHRDPVPQLNHARPLPGTAGGLASPDTDALLKQLKALQEQVALLDRIQNIR